MCPVSCLKDVADFLNCDLQLAQPEKETVEPMDNPLETLGHRGSIVRLEAEEKVRAALPATEEVDADALHINHPDTVARAEKDLAWPRVTNVVIKGRLYVGNIVTAHAEYCGGAEVCT